MIAYIGIIAILVLIIGGLGYYVWTRKNCPSAEDLVCPTCPSCPTCPACPTMPDPNKSVMKENELLKSMSKYLTLIIRKNSAEKELYRLENGHHRVFHSPRIDQINNQLALFKGQIKKDPNKLQFFEENLDLLI